MIKRKSASKPPTPSGNRQKKAPRKQTLALSTKDAVKRQTLAKADLIPKARALPKARPRAAGKAEPSMIANQIELLETLFKWTPLGFVLRYQELQRERAERYLGKRT